MKRHLLAILAVAAFTTPVIAQETGTAAAESSVIIYDYAKAGNPDPELLVKAGTSGYQVNMGVGKEDRTDRNFKGYKDYMGNNLPAVCNVFIGEEQKLGDGGLMVSQDRYLCVAGLVAGDTIRVQYANVPVGKQVTYCPGSSVETVAYIGEDSLVSGVNVIDSAASIVIKSVGAKNYMVLSVFKGMTISQISVKNSTAETIYNYAKAGNPDPEQLVKAGTSGYQVNMGVGKEDRTDRNFKGYKDYAGTNLPAVCNVFIGEEQKLGDGGLLVSQDRYMCVAGLADGDTVIVTYANVPDGKAVKYCPGASVDIKASIDGTELVSGESEVPSGASIVVTKAGTKGYIVMSIFKKMTISRVEIHKNATATGLERIPAVLVFDEANAPIYNLAGQRVSKDYRGVVIQNGRKFVQK